MNPVRPNDITQSPKDKIIRSNGVKIKLFLLTLLILVLNNPVLLGEDQFSRLREEMVKKQIMERGVTDKSVIGAMLKVPRHQFVPSGLKRLAYIDRPLPIGYDQTISQPYIVALMTEFAHLTQTDVVLEIGTGSGYQAAILAEIVDRVYTIEIIEPLATGARTKLQKMGYKNILVKCGDGYQGWEEYAPFDAIIVTAAPPRIPQPLIEQLKIGGRMVIPVGEIYQELKLITKTEKGLTEESLIPVHFVPMVGEINAQ